MTEVRQGDPVDRALENLGRVAVPVEESVHASRRRDRVVGVLGSALGRVRARRTFARRAWVAVFSVMSLGAVAAGVGVYAKLQEPEAPVIVAEEQWQARGVFGSVVVRDGRGERRLASGDALGIGDSIEAREGASVVLGLSSGDVRLRSGGRVELVSTTAVERKLKIAAGTVDVDLPRKLPKGQALILETPDAQVRVVGTAFSVNVALDANGKPATEVSVRRGTVWVMQRGERRATLNAGSKWRSTPEARVTASAPTPAPVADGRKVSASTAGER
ncbi:MAG TPA: FecR domain-containing protein, partial [Polyangiaceae bacterium]|nr:FecR domain-containing protein [Polyangiaceae bacterium]